MQAKILCFLCSVVVVVNCNNTAVSERDYGHMPELFHLDNFDQCMLSADDAVYCTFTFQLEPLYEDHGRFVWNIIQRLAVDPSKYRHNRLRHGICLSSSCPNYTKDSPRQSLENCYNNKYRYLGLKGNVTELKCLSKHDDNVIDIYDIIFAVSMMFYLVFIVFSSLYEGLARYKKREVYEKVTRTTAGRIITSFSLLKNWERLRKPNVNAESKKLRSIQGIRFYNMICVIMCHTLMITFAGPVANTQYVEDLTKKPLNMFVANGNYVVQTYFLISAWLLSFHFFQMFEGRKSISPKYIILAIVNRYVRLTPTMAVMIAFQSTWFIHLGKGPNWDAVVGQEYRNCRANGWTNLLYLNNYINKNDMCLHQTWYIASDTQLYIASVILLTIMWRNQRYMKLILGVVIVIGLFVQGGIAYINNYDIVIYQYPEALYDLRAIRVPIWHDLYSSGYSNIAGYAIGLTFGYIFYRCRNKIFVINRMHVVLWWILTFGLCNFIVLIGSVMYAPDFETTALGSAFYWAFGKNLFALGLAIGIFGFSQKIGWFARWFVEWSPTNVLGRLTYSTYIVHTALIRLRAGYLRSPVFANDYTLLMTTLGDIVLSYLVGTLLCLMFEMPMSALQKLMVPQIKNRKPKESAENSLKTMEDTCDDTEKEEEKV